MTYPLATDNAQVYGSYGVSGLPTTFFVNADGAIVGRQVGAMTESGIYTLVREVFGVTVSRRSRAARGAVIRACDHERCGTGPWARPASARRAE